MQDSGSGWAKDFSAGRGAWDGRPKVALRVGGMGAMTPEQRARVEIDRKLEQAGWAVQDHAAMNLHASRGAAVREFPLTTGFADYLLYADGKAIGVVEAKKPGTLIGVESQSARYVAGLPERVPAHRTPLPFHYESTGEAVQFTSLLDPTPRSREVFSFHRPEELLRLVELARQFRAGLQAMPPLPRGRLWPVQQRAIESIEASLATGHPRALVQMATGSGKTYTAVTLVYRLLRYAGAKRVLFLVDRNNLGKQTYGEFSQFDCPDSGYKFPEEYHVQHLQSNTIGPATRVCITTIQRLYAMLQGEEELDPEAEDGSMFEAAPELRKEPLPVAYSAAVPPEAFDVVIVDECHRSIYNLWRQVLEYFDAFLIGLTATPTKQTIGFFGGNLVMEYPHEQAVADGVNVGFDVYRIQTKIGTQGATIEAEPGYFVPVRDRKTRRVTYQELDEDLTYTAEQLDRDVVAHDQIRLVVRTFRDKLFTEIFPSRMTVPKTLVFAKDDNHAEDVTRIIREEFGKGNEFCQKITYRTTGKKPEELLQEFRTSYDPRIAVTVDMIATGTDVKPLECLLFLRNIRSACYFDQMIGRGVRVIDGDTLQGVTPDTRAKTHFVIVDAVGVCEEVKTATKPIDQRPSVSLKQLLQAVAEGVVDAAVTSTLGARLARLDRQLTEEQRGEIAGHAEGKAPGALASALLASVDADAVHARALAEMGAEPGEEGPEPTEEELRAAERALMTEALRPFHEPRLRETILAVKRAAEQIIDEVNRDELIDAGFDPQARERAVSLIGKFRHWVEESREEIEALKVLYSRPRRAGLRFEQVKELAAALRQEPLRTTPQALWRAFEAVEPEAVKGKGGDQLADVIALVRHAISPEEPVEPYAATVERRYQAWLAERAARGAGFTEDQRQWLDAIRDHIASSLRIEAEHMDYAPFAGMGGLGALHRLFGADTAALLAELNERLAA
jgi:type I restriction enzyme R subunit